MRRRRPLSSTRYDHLCDQALIRLAREGDPRACEYLLYKYRGLVRAKAHSYFLAGAEREDVLQIGMIGLWQAVADFRPEKNISFLSFARICVERHIITAIKASTRRKQAPLNEAISLDRVVSEGEAEFGLGELIVSDAELDPEELLLRREDAKQLRSVLRAILSRFEWEVLRRYNLGQSYVEIACELRCKPKSVDNALGRVKRKVCGSRGALVL